MTTVMTHIPQGKYHIWTVGCQMNQADSQRIQSILDDLGWEETTIDNANLVVLNTCSVRQAPEDKAHNLLARLRHAKERRSDLLVALMGCMIGNQKTIDALHKRYPHIDLYLKVEHADILPHFLEERWTPLAGAGYLNADFLPEQAPYTPPLPAEGEDSCHVDPALPIQILAPVKKQRPTIATSMQRSISSSVLPMAITPKPGERIAHYPTKIEQAKASPLAWLPIMLGCNKVCTYCIVPYRRGRERSRPIDELMSEAQTLVMKGAKELTLLGQTIEGYGLDLPEKPDLADLMTSLSTIDGLKRIRFMTSYPQHMTDSMIERMAHLPKVCEHLNIPVQSGDDAMLKRMKRGYTLAEYCERIESVRKLWPNISLSTDIIVGFCDETDEEFQHTLDLLEKIRFDVVHVAAYSVRPGTVASRWEDDVPLEEKKRRLHAVEEVQAHIALEINQTYVGRVEEVMVEDTNSMHGNRLLKGHNRANKWVFFPVPDTGLEARPGDMFQVRIERATAWSLQGCAVLYNMHARG